MAIISNGTTVASGGNVQAPTLTGNLPALNGSSLTNVPAGIELFEVKTFTSSTTYTPTSGTKFVRVYATGGGGGGGGGGVGSQSEFLGSGGNAGNTGVKHYTDTELGSSATITIGSGGSGGSGQNNGSAGGNTTFAPGGTGSVLTAYGGYPGYRLETAGKGLHNTGNNTGTGNADYVYFGGHAHTGDQTLYEGSTRYYVSGKGGDSMFGYGGHGKITSGQINQNGNNGSRGGGGGGCIARQYANDISGGSGGSGLVIVEEYK